MFNRKTKFKGRKAYAIAGGEFNNIIGIDADIERVKRNLDDNWPILVELTITRVFTRERELVEIETDI